MNTDQIRETFAAAGIDVEALTFVPRKAIHAYMVAADAWLSDDGLLMFVGSSPASVVGFMYYIGEERGRGMVGVGRGIVAYKISNKRVDWIVERLPARKGGAHAR